MTKEQFLLLTTVAFLLVAGLVLVLPPAWFIHVANVTAITVGFAILFVFWDAIGIVFTTKGRLPAGHVLALGIVLLTTGIILRHIAHYVGMHVSVDAGGQVMATLTPLPYLCWAAGMWAMLSGAGTVLYAVTKYTELRDSRRRRARRRRS